LLVVVEETVDSFEDPEAVVRAGFQALAKGDAAALVGLADAESFELVRQARIAIAGAAANEWRSASPQEFVERLLNGLPSLRASIRCEIVGHVLEGPETAHVLFRLGWGRPAVLTEPIHVATLKHRREGWRLTLNLLSDWLLPGFQNLLLSDQVGT
jgi:hypothetical protein